MRELALFAGAGGGILGGGLLGWRTVCAIEIDPYARSVLLQRQADGCLTPRFPVWDDVRTFDGRPWRNSVDVITGGFPCQDISSAGRGAGIDGERSGLWVEMARIVREVRPRFVFVENSPNLVSRGLDRVLGDLAESGYDARWRVLGAVDVGAPHRRLRIWIKGTRRDATDPESVRRGSWGSRRVAPPGQDGIAARRDATDPDGGGCKVERIEKPTGVESTRGGELDGCGSVRKFEDAAGRQAIGVRRWPVEPNMGRVVADGMAGGLVKHRSARLRCIGNGQVPSVAALAWRLLT